MADGYVDCVNGDDLNDGLTENTPKKTVSGCQAAGLPGLANTLYFAPGHYDSADGTIGYTSGGANWKALNYGTVHITDAAGGGYRTWTSNAYISQTFYGLVFENFTDDVFDSTYAGGNNYGRPRFFDCLFKNMTDCQLLKSSTGTAFYPWFERCVLDNWDNSTVPKPIVGGLSYINSSGTGSQQGAFIYNTVVNCDFGTGSMLALGVVDTDYQFHSNIISQCTANHIIWTASMADGYGGWSTFGHNCYYSYTAATGLVTTSTQSHANLAAFQANTAGGDNSDELNPGLLDVPKGLYGAVVGGNSERTGLGLTDRGAFGLTVGC